MHIYLKNMHMPKDKYFYMLNVAIIFLTLCKGSWATSNVSVPTATSYLNFYSKHLTQQLKHTDRKWLASLFCTPLCLVIQSRLLTRYYFPYKCVPYLNSFQQSAGFCCGLCNQLECKRRPAVESVIVCASFMWSVWRARILCFCSLLRRGWDI